MAEERAREESLFGDAEGWRLEPAVRWLAAAGRLIADPVELVGALCERLLALGAPLWRMRVGLRTIHPEIFAWGITWVRGKGCATVHRVGHHVPGSSEYIGSPIQALHRTGKPVRRRLERLDESEDHAILHELAAEGGRDYLAIPLVFSDGQINSLTVTTDRAGGFSDADVGKFLALADFLAPVAEAHALRRIARALAETYVGKRAGERVLRGLIKRGDAEVIDAVLWFSDLRGSTRLAETLPPESFLAILNAYFEAVAAAVTARGGEVLRFVGDAMLVIFPTGAPGNRKAACAAALDAANDAFAAIEAVNARRRRAGEPEIRFGVGLHVGSVIYGNVGAPDRLDFTVMGPAVNRAARIEALTKTLGRRLLMSAAFAREIDADVVFEGRHVLAGVAKPQKLYALGDGRPPRPAARAGAAGP